MNQYYVAVNPRTGFVPVVVEHLTVHSSRVDTGYAVVYVPEDKRTSIEAEQRMLAGIRRDLHRSGLMSAHIER